MSKAFNYLLICLLFSVIAQAHPLPNTVVAMQLTHKNIGLTIKMPLHDFQIAFGDTVTEKSADLLAAYFQKHIKIIGTDQQIWQQQFMDYSIAEASYEVVGKYEVLTVHLVITPSSNASLRTFDLHYDVMIHQIPTHSALIYVQEDWEGGIHEHPVQAGIVGVDIPTGKISPLHINLGNGNMWKGFKSMLQLGMRHIAEGIDHLLFLITLLFPAPLLLKGAKWGQFGGLKYSLLKLLKITGAFTIGHSVTLLLGSLGWIPFNSQIIEVGIACSILISAIHSIKPMFYNKEIYVAAGFGLIHGLAFSDTLSPLHLDVLQMGISVLGFNLGIEIMQIGIILLILPAMLLLIISRADYYTLFRKVIAILSGIAAIAWMAERASGVPNIITLYLEQLLPYSIWLIAYFTFVAAWSFLSTKEQFLRNFIRIK